MDFNKFKGFYPTLDRALSIVPNHMIHSLVFSRREDEFSVGLIMHQRGEEYQAKFEELIGYVLVFRNRTIDIGIFKKFRVFKWDYY